MLSDRPLPLMRTGLSVILLWSRVLPCSRPSCSASRALACSPPPCQMRIRKDLCTQVLLWCRVALGSRNAATLAAGASPRFRAQNSKPSRSCCCVPHVPCSTLPLAGLLPWAGLGWLWAGSQPGPLPQKSPMGVQLGALASALRGAVHNDMQLGLCWAGCCPLRPAHTSASSMALLECSA